MATEASARFHGPGEPTGSAVLHGHELNGFVARSAEETAGVVEGISLVLRVPEGQLRIVPVEAVERISESDRELAITPSIDPHGFPRHRSLRRLDERWRIDASFDVPRMEADYWLAHCHAFLVNAPTEDVGVVDEVLFDSHGNPVELLVNTGGFRRRLVSIPIAEVVEIIPERRTLGVQRDHDR